MQKISSTNLVTLFRTLFTPWRSPEGTVYVDTTEGETFPLYDSKFVGYVHRNSPEVMWADKTLKEAQGYLYAQAFSEEPREVSMRVALQDGKLYYDTGKGVIQFSEGKWKEVPSKDAPRFVRGGGMLPQMEAKRDIPPLRGHKIVSFVDMLQEFLPALDRPQLLLIVGWLVGCYQPGGPYPILMLNGEQGSAKSTTTKLLRRLIDPHALEMRDPTLDDKGFIAAAKNSFVLAFDNVSYMPHKMSDLLCRVATGTAALGSRQLYTDHSEAAFTVLRPIILNGIPEMTQREDFASRTISISLPPISDELRRDDPEFWKTFEEKRAVLLGALYDMVAKAHHERDLLPLSERPRLIGFLQWASAAFAAADRALFLQTFKDNSHEAEIALLEQDLFLQGVIAMMQSKKHFTGTVFDLQNALQAYIPTGFNRDHMPNSPKGIHERIKRAAPVLRSAGILYFKGARAGGSGRRQFSMEWTQEAAWNNYAVSVKSA